MRSGARPIDLHLKAFEAMGLRWSHEGDGYGIYLPKAASRSKYLHGHCWRYATINTMIAAVKAKGRTVTEKCGRGTRNHDVYPFEIT